MVEGVYKTEWRGILRSVALTCFNHPMVEGVYKTLMRAVMVGIFDCFNHPMVEGIIKRLEVGQLISYFFSFNHPIVEGVYKTTRRNSIHCSNSVSITLWWRGSIKRCLSFKGEEMCCFKHPMVEGAYKTAETSRFFDPLFSMP